MLFREGALDLPLSPPRGVRRQLSHFDMVKYSKLELEVARVSSSPSSALRPWVSQLSSPGQAPSRRQSVTAKSSRQSCSQNPKRLSEIFVPPCFTKVTSWHFLLIFVSFFNKHSFNHFGDSAPHSWSEAPLCAHVSLP